MKTRGFSLVELMVTVAIVGVLAALATVGVRTYVSSARTTEARNAVGQMAKDATTAYAREYMAGAVLAKKKGAVAQSRLCVSASKSVPANASKIKGRKYQSSPAEWTADAKTLGKGFACLKFSMTDPQYYVYRYTTSTNNVNSAGNVNTTFDAIAQGDLNGNGKLSTIKLSGKIVAAGKGKELIVAPSFSETNPEE
jgi:type IV pilus assembly protein PilA